MNSIYQDTTIHLIVLMTFALLFSFGLFCTWLVWKKVNIQLDKKRVAFQQRRRAEHLQNNPNAPRYPWEE